MGDKSNIEWCDSTWNPTTGCTKVSAGCKHCYAERWFPRVYGKQEVPMAASEVPGHIFDDCGDAVEVVRDRRFTDVRCHPERLDIPLRWRKPRRVFVNSMSDLFHESVPDDFIDRVFAVMALAPQHTFQVLTKRPERMLKYLERKYYSEYGNEELGNAINDLGGDPLDWTPPIHNIWLGVSCEDQATADERIPLLLQTPAAVRFVSCEPLLGPVDLCHLQPADPPVEIDCLAGTHGVLRPHGGKSPRVDWIIAGGESGPHARPMHPDWARSLRDQCQAAGVPYFFKQWGEWTPGENVQRQSGWVSGAHWFDDHWIFEDQNLASTDGHIDDEPDLYRVGKHAAGRLLDGQIHDGYPT